MDSLERIKTDLRAKYLQDRDDLQQQVSNDPEQWTDEKMNEAVKKVIKLSMLPEQKLCYPARLSYSSPEFFLYWRWQSSK